MAFHRIATTIGISMLLSLGNAAAQELLQNASFEEWTEQGLLVGWIVENTAIITQESANVLDGEYSIRLESPSTSNLGVYQLIPVSEGLTYSFSAELHGITGNHDLGLYINWLDESGAVITGSGTFYNNTGGEFEHVISGEIIAPLGAAQARCRIRCYADNAVGGYADLASFRFVDNPSTPTPTPTGPTPTPSPIPSVSIHDIQYTINPSGDSPYFGQTIITQGVVTASESGNDYVFLQDGQGPWSGILLYRIQTPVSVGDRIEVMGIVEEYYNMTELNPVLDCSIVSSGQVIPVPEILDTAVVSAEQWEGVLVRSDDVTVTQADLGYGEWEVDDGSGSLRVDDMFGYQYEPVTGDSLQLIQGPCHFNFGVFKIEPRNDNDIIPVPITPTATPAGSSPTPTALPFVNIYDIQYTTDPAGASPYAGRTVATQGIVTACEEDNWTVFIQDGSGPWTGIILYHPTIPVERGDRIEVIAGVTEYYGLTELDPILFMQIIDHETEPTAQIISTHEIAHEQWESVLVRSEQVTVTNPDTGFGQWEITDGTGPADVDDLFTYSYTPVLNDVLSHVQGVVLFQFDEFMIEPRDDGDIGRMDTPTPTPPASRTPTLPPTPTPTHSPPPTSIPTCPRLGVTIEMPDNHFTPGDMYYLNIQICNPTSVTYTDMPLFVILDLGNQFFFAPRFNDFDYYSVTVTPNQSILPVLPEFNWPDGTGEASGIMWYAGFTTQDFSELWGEMDDFMWGWGR